jgi:probable selenium-dependent hydroxylase accessory protein YqeC
VEIPVKDLSTALGLGAREHVAVVGAGGKTSLMFALAKGLRSKGGRVVTGTTTKIWYREALRFPCVIFSRSDSAWHKKVSEELKRCGRVFVGRGVLESGKLEGITPDLADVLYQDPDVDYVIIEADGAAGLPVKVPASHEPVIPSSTTVVVAMMGLEVMGRNLEPDFVFRLDRFQDVTGLAHGQPLTPVSLARIFHSPEGLFKGAPVSARRIAFLNKLDLLPDDRETREMADLLLRPPETLIDRVVIGSIRDRNYWVIRKNHEGYFYQDY